MTAMMVDPRQPIPIVTNEAVVLANLQIAMGTSPSRRALPSSPADKTPAPGLPGKKSTKENLFDQIEVGNAPEQPLQSPPQQLLPQSTQPTTQGTQPPLQPSQPERNICDWTLDASDTMQILYTVTLKLPDLWMQSLCASSLPRRIVTKHIYCKYGAHEQ